MPASAIDLPTSVLARVLYSVRYSDLLRVARVCSAWKYVLGTAPCVQARTFRKVTKVIVHELLAGALRLVGEGFQADDLLLQILCSQGTRGIQARSPSERVPGLNFVLQFFVTRPPRRWHPVVNRVHGLIDQPRTVSSLAPTRRSSRLSRARCRSSSARPA